MSYKKILELVKKNPGELSFVYDSHTYDDYLKTYTDIGGSIEEAFYSEDEFKILKDYFGSNV